MLGMSERPYAAPSHGVGVGLSRGAIQKAKAAGWLVLYDDGEDEAVVQGTGTGCHPSRRFA